MAMAFETAEDGTLLFSESGETVLSATCAEEGNKIRMALSGAMRTETLTFLEDEILAFISFGGSVELDMKAVRYMAASAMRMFLRIQQKADEKKKAEFVLKNVPEGVMRMLEQNGLADCLNIEK